MHDVVVHCGHCFRTRGATGTAGHRGTEQQFAAKVGAQMGDLLRLRGYDVFVAYPTEHDDNLPRCKVFVSLHQDGSTNPRAQGASVGYPSSGDGATVAQIWKAHYAAAGWPSGFRPDNYSSGLPRFYGFRRINADAKFLIEHGFATNRGDADWMWDNLGTIVRANCDALTQYLGLGKPPAFPTAEAFEEGDMQIINDPNQRRMWAGWTKNGTQHVDEYSKYVEGAGTLMPNVSYVIDDQVAKGNIVKVG